MTYVIKRYSNRKLYDLQESRYVTLEGLERLIRDGKDLAVVDAATGGNLIAITLVQILLERERGRRGGLSPALLHAMIRHGEAWPDVLQRTLRSTLEQIIPGQPEADGIVRAWAVRVGLTPPGESPESAGVPPLPARDAESPQSEVKVLREKIRELDQERSKREGG